MRKANYIAHFEEMIAHNKRYDAGQETCPSKFRRALRSD